MPVLVKLTLVVYLLIPTSNHNCRRCRCCLLSVVYLLIPTSNHNHYRLVKLATALYIFWFLHQTTTMNALGGIFKGCISFDSYIKPQLQACLFFRLHGCISFDSYIKPQRASPCLRGSTVVYLLIPTSNHNSESGTSGIVVVVYLLIPTSNHNKLQTINETGNVVYLLIPTSNHNLPWGWPGAYGLYIFWFLHQTTTYSTVAQWYTALYIFWFLHQTTTYLSPERTVDGCISFDSYIKPQLLAVVLVA